MKLLPIVAVLSAAAFGGLLRLLWGWPVAVVVPAGIAWCVAVWVLAPRWLADSPDEPSSDS
jgi:hypothetical protein